MLGTYKKNIFIIMYRNSIVAQHIIKEHNNQSLILVMLEVTSSQILINLQIKMT